MNHQRIPNVSVRTPRTTLCFRMLQRMKPIMFIMAVGAFALGFGTKTFSAQNDFNLAFSASGSAFQGGPAGGFDYSADTGGDIGISYRARANAGTVSAHLNGTLRVGYPATIPPNGPATVSLQFIGTPNGASVASEFGANVNVDAHVAFSTCVIPSPWGGCWVPVSVNENLSLLDEGFYLNPNNVSTPVIGSPTAGSDTDNAYGIGPSIDIEIGELGAYVLADVQQNIQFTPTAIS